MTDSHKIIAVVDDDPEMRAAMASLLSAYGYGAETFDSAQTFLTCASTSRATCLVVDIQLGDISGVELAHQLAADGFTYPIIFMAALDDEVIRNQAVAAGGIAFTQAVSRANAVRRNQKGGPLGPAQCVTW
jgi:FixJ family two-component response regulator